MANPHVNFRVVTVVVEHLDFDLRHWCRTCNLSTGVRQWLVTRSDSGMRLQTRVWCHECGGHDVVVDPDAQAA